MDHREGRRARCRRSGSARFPSWVPRGGRGTGSVGAEDHCLEVRVLLEAVPLEVVRRAARLVVLEVLLPAEDRPSAAKLAEEQDRAVAAAVQWVVPQERVRVRPLGVVLLEAEAGPCNRRAVVGPAEVLQEAQREVPQAR